MKKREIKNGCRREVWYRWSWLLPIGRAEASNRQA